MKNGEWGEDIYSGWSLAGRDRDFIQSMMPFWKLLYEHYFRVETAGWEQIPAGQVLIVGSHNGGLAAPDMHMMMYDWFRRFGVDRSVYGLMHQQVSLVMPQVAQMAVRTGAVHAHPRMAQAAFQAGASVLVYPGGAVDVFRPHRLRDRICLNDNMAFIKLALRWEVPIVPAISWGAHDTLWVLEDFYPWVKQLHDWGMPWLFDIDPIVFPVYLGLPWGLAIGPFPNIPLPMPMKTQVLAPIEFERYGKAASRDRDYVAACYERVRSEMQTGLNRLTHLNPYTGIFPFSTP
jgi:1-acyl-sn-glycerol-3-phosphate acyltransferase